MPKQEMVRAEVYVPPVQSKQIERQGGTTQPRVRRYPEVRAGVCEFHGTVNPHAPGEKQYLYCPDDGKHPKWGELQCSYCEEYKDPADVIKKSVVNIYDSPFDPNQLIVVCDNFTCVAAHQKRFKVNS